MPFFETALISDEEEQKFLHFGAVRYRITGSGKLDSELIGLGDVNRKTLSELTMSVNSSIEPRLLSNIKSQKVRLRVSTDKVNETFDISKIIIFAKSIWSESPQ